MEQSHWPNKMLVHVEAGIYTLLLRKCYTQNFAFPAKRVDNDFDNAIKILHKFNTFLSIECCFFDCSQFDIY